MYVVIAYYGFNFPFSNAEWYWTSFHVLIFNLYILFDEMSALKYLSDNSNIFVILMIASIGFSFKLRFFRYLVQWMIFYWNLDTLCITRLQVYFHPPLASSDTAPVGLGEGEASLLPGGGRRLGSPPTYTDTRWGERLITPGQGWESQIPSRPPVMLPWLRGRWASFLRPTWSSLTQE